SARANRTRSRFDAGTVAAAYCASAGEWYCSQQRRTEPEPSTRVRLSKKRLQVERPREHAERPIGVAWPLLLRAVSVELDPCEARIVQVERFADGVVRRPVELDACSDETTQRVGQSRPSRVPDRDVIETRGPWSWRRAALAFPGVQPNVMVVAPRRDEDRLATVARLFLEAEDVAPEAQRSLDVGNLQVDVANINAGIYRPVAHADQPSESPWLESRMRFALLSYADLA